MTDESKSNKIAEVKQHNAEKRALKEEARSLIKEHNRLKRLHTRAKKKIEVLERTTARLQNLVDQRESGLTQKIAINENDGIEAQATLR